MRDSFIFYRSFFESMDGLNDKQKLEIFNAICNYSLNFQESDLSGISKSIFTLMKPNLDANNKRYVNGTKGGEYGIKGGRPKNPKQTPDVTPRKPQENPIETPNQTPNKDKDVDKDKDDNDDVDGDGEKKPTTPVFIEEIREQLDSDFYAYLQSREQLKTPIELIPDYASKINCYFTLVQVIPLFKQKIKHLPNKSENSINSGIREWLRYNAIKKTNVSWENYADMAQHCINFMLKPKQ